MQTPGVMGVGKYYLVSPKFISADGGFKRVVWMSKVLKATMADELQHVAEREGIPDLIDRIADGDKIATVEQLEDWVEEVRHPVLEMPPMSAPREGKPERLPAERAEVLDQATAVVEEAIAKNEKAAAAKETMVVEQPAEKPATPTFVQETKPIKPILTEPAPPLPAPPIPVSMPATQGDMLQQAHEAALRQALALQQAAAEALRQAEFLGKAREMAAKPTTPTEAVDHLRQALAAALSAGLCNRSC